MPASETKKFLVLYLAPVAVLEDWARTDPAIRQPAEQKMQAAWGEWMREHGKMVLSTQAGGATKLVMANGISDTRNDIMLLSFIEAETQEEAAKAFEHHPHLQIPESSIQVMAVRPMSGP